MTGVDEWHVPDVCTPSGLLDLIALGNLCELGVLIQRETYSGWVEPEMLEETLVARQQYRKI